MQPEDYRDAVQARAAALLEAARHNLTKPVPHCPGWTVTNVVEHVGGVHAWAAAILVSGVRQTWTGPPPGTAGEALLDWAGEQARTLVDALGRADPGAECWTFGLPRSALFWFRRQALETAVHARDAQDAAGSSHPLPADLAADGVAEFLDVLLPRYLERRPGAWSGQTVHLHRTDGDGEWAVRLGPEGAVAVERAHAKGDLAARGPASDLYLWALNRGRGSVELLGDLEVADRWRSEITF